MMFKHIEKESKQGRRKILRVYIIYQAHKYKQLNLKKQLHL